MCIFQQKYPVGFRSKYEQEAILFIEFLKFELPIDITLPTPKMFGNLAFFDSTNVWGNL